MTDITPPPPHLLKKFSEQARVSSQKRGAPNYLKTFAILCIEWAMNSQPTPNDRQIRSSDITPPPELVQQWCEQLFGCPDEPEISAYELVRLAAQYGADQELEACCDWLEQQTLCGHRDLLPSLRAARRPKPPSLKEQALEAARIELDPNGKNGSLILRALEALPDD